MNRLALLLSIVQACAALRVFGRMIRTANGSRIRLREDAGGRGERVTVLVPVLNEAARLNPCLEGLSAQGPEVETILVIDGGSDDGTQDLVRRWGGRDTRIRLIDASPVPPDVNGKAHGLQTGYENSDRSSEWIMTIDADVRPQPELVASMVGHARSEKVNALSVATRQQLSGPAEGIVHPAMLASLVYRFGIPGHATSNLQEVQANGQCFLARRSVLNEVGGFSLLMHDVAEDVTLARLIARGHHRVGFYESDDLVHVEMYASWRDAWDNWARSLPMRDRFTTVSSFVALAEATLTQVLPFWMTILFSLRLGRRHPATTLNVGLLAGRMGVLAGMARAYRIVPWTYWISPLADIAVLARIWVMWGRRVHVWRGRRLVSGETP